MADGFSCKTQVEQPTRRRALHMAQAIKMALDFGEDGTPRGELPENRNPDIALDGPSPDLKAATLLGGALTGGALLWVPKRRHR